MVAGNWVPELVEKAAGKNLFGIAGAHSPWIDWDTIRSSNPDILVLMPCGWNIEKICKELSSLEKLLGWKDLAAVKNKKVFVVDGNAYFNRPGPRLVDSLEILYEIFYMSDRLAECRFHGKGWIAV
jgi:iron complex transport system substrate-binding protein